ncbi:MAG: glycosyltransferase family 2 protein [Acidimicrobiales bacterium]
MTQGLDPWAVSVVIVNYRTAGLTLAAALSVLGEDEVREVVIVDNASGDSSHVQLANALSNERVRILASPTNVGFGQGMNLGVSTTSTPIVLLLNSDAEIVGGSIGPMVAELEADPRLALVAPRILESDRVTLQRDTFGDFPKITTLLFPKSRRVELTTDASSPEWVSGVAMLLRREAFDRIGGFDSSFMMYVEDIDLCRRIREDGWGIKRCLSASVVHTGGASEISIANRDRWLHESMITYFRRAGEADWKLALLDRIHPLGQRIRRWKDRLKLVLERL